MSIRLYATTPELVGTGKKLFATRFSLILGTRLAANAKPRMKEVKYTVTGTSMAAVFSHGFQIASKIGAGVNACMMKFSAILGHYRADKALPVVPINQSRYGIVSYSPNPAAGDGFEALNLKLFVPWWNGSVANLEGLAFTGTYGSDTAQLGVVRWADQDSNELEALPGTTLLGSNIKNITYVRDESLVEDNTTDDETDGVLAPIGE